MTLPIENSLALFPAPERVGKLELKPLTVGGAVLLDALGVDPRGDVEVEQTLLAAAVLAFPDKHRLIAEGLFDYERIPKLLAEPLTVLQKAVNAVIRRAWATYVAPKPGNGSTGGNGWALDLVEFLMHSYRMSAAEAIETPLALAWALAVVRRSTFTDHGEPDYIERAKIRAMREQGDL